MARWGWLHSLLAALGAARRAETAPGVVFDAAYIRSRSADGQELTLPWADLDRVTIVTNDAGPFAADLHWILAARDRRLLAVAMGTPGEQELLRELQRRFADFDNEAVIRAMGSTGNATFEVWRRRPIN
jgi:hypothetical protein